MFFNQSRKSEIGHHISKSASSANYPSVTDGLYYVPGGAVTPAIWWSDSKQWMWFELTFPEKITLVEVIIHLHRKEYVVCLICLSCMHARNAISSDVARRRHTRFALETRG